MRDTVAVGGAGSCLVGILLAGLAAAGGCSPTGAAARSDAPAASDTASAMDSLADLPLKVVRPAEGRTAPDLAVLLTGDGGWAAIDKEIADSLSQHGIAVVALNSREYLSSKRSPARVAADVGRIVRHYGKVFGKRELVLIGYSRGADIMPFVATRLPPELLAEVRLIALLGLAPNANFQFHLIDLVSNHHRSDDLPTIPEVTSLRGRDILCFYGVEEEEAACRSLPDSLATVVAMPDGHHFGARYGQIADRILSELGATVTTSPSRP
jgi:type IV secretory pathway VirJ component